MSRLSNLNNTQRHDPSLSLHTAFTTLLIDNGNAKGGERCRATSAWYVLCRIAALGNIKIARTRKEKNNVRGVTVKRFRDEHWGDGRCEIVKR